LRRSRSGCCLPDEAVGQAYSVKPIRLVVGFTPGGTTDIVAREIAARMQEGWGRPVLAGAAQAHEVGDVAGGVLGGVSGERFLADDADHNSYGIVRRRQRFDGILDFYCRSCRSGRGRILDTTGGKK
jgi:hypothetical protein